MKIELFLQTKETTHLCHLAKRQGSSNTNKVKFCKREGIFWEFNKLQRQMGPSDINRIIKQQLMQNNNKSCTLKLIFMILFSSLFVVSSSANWQGSGNMSASNMTQIWSYINGAILYTVKASKYDSFNTNLSNHLNSKWDPAWNVYTIVTVSGADAILYGYAFRDHWMWYNGYFNQNKMLSFIIWKDYNCGKWNTVGTNNTAVKATFTTQEVNTIYSVIGTFATQSIDDIWVIAKSFVDKLQLTSDFATKELSMIVTQNSAGTSVYGKVCSISNNQNYGSISFSGGKSGRYHLFQTRVIVPEGP